MTTAIPPDMKPLTAYIRRAEELEKDGSNPDSRIIAYYCRSYAMEKGIKIKSTAAETKSFLLSLMTTLEASKKTLQIKDDAGAVICENFAQSVFTKADDEDRAGAATKDTAKTFYAAATFFDILEQFGDLDTEIQEKRRYSKWKAADILNAIKAGRQPTPGAPGETFGDAEGSIGGGSIQGGLGQAGLGQVQQQFPYQDPFSSIPTAPTIPPVSIPPPAPFSAQQQQPMSYQYQPGPPTAAHQGQVPPYSSSSPQPFDPPTYSPPPPTQAYQPPSQQSKYQPSAPIVPLAAAADVTPASVLSGVTGMLTNMFPNNTGTGGGASSVSGRGQPVSSSDPRVKDAVELCSFAIAALKHNEINLAKDRLREALRRLE